jgi:tRNA(fMet)-specific endonuclease VapC
MNGNDIFFDTNIVIEIFSSNQEIIKKYNGLSSIYISSIVLGELYIGINRVANKAKHLQKLIDFVQLCTILVIDEPAAKIFGEISAELYKKGKPIPTNDIWIAATVKQHNLTLITRDKHFSEIGSIIIDAW